MLSSLRLISSIFLLSFAAYSQAEEDKSLLGEIENGLYKAPNGVLEFKLPSKEADNKDIMVNDFISPSSLNINIENSKNNTRHRIIYSYFVEKTYKLTLEKRLFQFNNLMTRTFDGEALLIHFDKHKNINRYIYKQAGKEQVRFHYVQALPFKDRIVIVWSDFIEQQDTPENEDKIIDGPHEVIVTAQNMVNSIE